MSTFINQRITQASLDIHHLAVDANYNGDLMYRERVLRPKRDILIQHLHSLLREGKEERS